MQKDLLITNDKTLNVTLEQSDKSSFEILSSNIDVSVLDTSNTYKLGVSKDANSLTIDNVFLEYVLENKKLNDIQISNSDNLLVLDLNVIQGVKGDVGEKGEQGVAGFSGNSEAHVLGETVLAFKVVMFDDIGNIMYASSNTMASINRVIGISLQSGNIGDSILIQNYGTLENLGWNWEPNMQLFLGLNGEITTDWTVGVYMQIIGFVISPTKIFINIGKVTIRG